MRNKRVWIAGLIGMGAAVSLLLPTTGASAAPWDRDRHDNYYGRRDRDHDRWERERAWRHRRWEMERERRERIRRWERERERREWLRRHDRGGYWGPRY